MKPFLLLFLSFILALAWKDNTLNCIPHTTAKELAGKLWNLEQLFISC